MGQIVVNGASLMCPMGMPGTASLIVLPTSHGPARADQPVATIMDNKPTGQHPDVRDVHRRSRTRQVAAATSAASGVLTPRRASRSPRPMGARVADRDGREQARADLGQQLHVPVRRQDLDHHAGQMTTTTG